VFLQTTSPRGLPSGAVAFMPTSVKKTKTTTPSDANLGLRSYHLGTVECERLVTNASQEMIVETTGYWLPGPDKGVARLVLKANLYD